MGNSIKKISNQLVYLSLTLGLAFYFLLSWHIFVKPASGRAIVRYPHDMYQTFSDNGPSSKAEDLTFYISTPVSSFCVNNRDFPADIPLDSVVYLGFLSLINPSSEQAGTYRLFWYGTAEYNQWLWTNSSTHPIKSTNSYPNMAVFQTLPSIIPTISVNEPFSQWWLKFEAAFTLALRDITNPQIFMSYSEPDFNYRPKFQGSFKTNCAEVRKNYDTLKQEKWPEPWNRPWRRWEWDKVYTEYTKKFLKTNLLFKLFSLPGLLENPVPEMLLFQLSNQRNELLDRPVPKLPSKPTYNTLLYKERYYDLLK